MTAVFYVEKKKSCVGDLKREKKERKKSDQAARGGNQALLKLPVLPCARDPTPANQRLHCPGQSV